MRRLLVAPQRWLDPTSKGHRPGLAPLVPGGCYLDITDRAEPFDVTGLSTPVASIRVVPVPALLVTGASGEPASKVHGTKQTVNLLRRINEDFGGSTLWRWVERHETVDESLRFLVSLANSKGHFYALEIDYPDGVTLARYAEAQSEPRLRPTTYGIPAFGNVVATIQTISGREHPVFDKIVIKRRILN